MHKYLLILLICIFALEMNVAAQPIVGQAALRTSIHNFAKNIASSNVATIKYLKKSDVHSLNSENIKDSKIINNQVQTIHRQRILVLLLIVILILVIFLVIYINKNYKNKKKSNKELEDRVKQRTHDLNVLNDKLTVELLQRRKVEASLRTTEERYRYLFERNPASMLIYERDTYNILAVNEAFEKEYGYTAREAMAMILTDFFPEQEKVDLLNLSEKLVGHEYVGEWHTIKKDGTIITIIASSHDLDYIGKKSRIVVITNITKLKKTEDEIVKLNQTLEDRVADRTVRLSTINKELESFSYSISHDLRAPLRAIYGFSQILSTRYLASLNEEGQQYLKYIVDASVRMEHLINDLLNYSRLGRKSLVMIPISIGEIVDEVCMDFKQKMDKIGATVNTDEILPVVFGDESLFRQIFTNLIDNAINYRQSQVPLEIGIHCEQDTNGCILKISDNGIGIPNEYLEKIFNIFQRLHTDDEYPGTGIGLATVRKAVSMLNGTIVVESVMGKGSTFIINIPETKENL